MSKPYADFYVINLLSYTPIWYSRNLLYTPMVYFSSPFPEKIYALTDISI